MKHRVNWTLEIFCVNLRLSRAHSLPLPFQNQMMIDLLWWNIPKRFMQSHTLISMLCSECVQRCVRISRWNIISSKYSIFGILNFKFFLQFSMTIFKCWLTRLALLQEYLTFYAEKFAEIFDIEGLDKNFTLILPFRDAKLDFDSKVRIGNHCLCSNNWLNSNSWTFKVLRIF